MFNRSVVPVAILALTAAACNRHQATIQATPTAVSVVMVDRETLAIAGATPGLVIVLRDADLPDRPLPEGMVALGRPGTDPRTGRGVRMMTGPDGLARPVVADTGAFTVLALRIGSARFQFDIRLEPNCHQTLEIYLGRNYISLSSSPGPRRTPSRAVLTTCAPATA